MRIGGWSWRKCCIGSGRTLHQRAAAAVVEVAAVVGRDSFDESAFPRTRAAVGNGLGNDVGPRMMTQPGLQRTGRFGGHCGLLGDSGRSRNSY